MIGTCLAIYKAACWVTMGASALKMAGILFLGW